MRHAAALAAFCIVGAADPGAAAAQDAAAVSAADPDSVVRALRTLGFRGTRTEDPYGDPMIESSAEGVDFNILFYGCEGNVDCTVIQFRAGFDLEDGTTLAAVNEWNAARIFGKAFLDEENDPFVEMTLEMSRPMPFDTFAANHEWWRAVLAGFQDHIGW
ncbi:MAG: YbjN domain-containing protein [Paracoccaceae bacterium]